MTDSIHFRLHNGDTSSSSCSTLSDEDSTPHVSRSNSYGRSENDQQGGHQGAPPHDGSYDCIYLRDDHLSPKKGTTPNLLFATGGGGGDGLGPGQAHLDHRVEEDMEHFVSRHKVRLTAKDDRVSMSGLHNSRIN